MPEFPSARFARCGATPELLAELEELFDRQAEKAQHDLVAYVAGVSDTDVRRMLEQHEQNTRPVDERTVRRAQVQALLDTRRKPRQRRKA